MSYHSNPIKHSRVLHVKKIGVCAWGEWGERLRLERKM